MLEPSVTPPTASNWLIRIPEVFAAWENDILNGLSAKRLKVLGREFRLVKLEDSAKLWDSAAAKYLRWNLPVHHSWPCCPRDTDGFIEKAARALAGKFGGLAPQTVLVGAFDPGDPNRYYRTLASNLRGRTLQLFAPAGAMKSAEEQDRQAPTLFCMVGKEGLFCGLQPPAAARGFYPGGTKFVRQNAPGTISRAGAKIAEALHQLRLYQNPPPAGGHWLELGASPGGMSAELLDRGYRVTAVDRAPLDARLAGACGLRFVLADAAAFRPEPGAAYDAILSDMNGDPRESIAKVIRLTDYLRPGGLVVFTLKLADAENFAAANVVEADVAGRAVAASLRVIARTHLTYNRHEFTLFLAARTPPESTGTMPPVSSGIL